MQDFQIWLNHNFGGQVSESDIERAKELFKDYPNTVPKKVREGFGNNNLYSSASTNALAN